MSVKTSRSGFQRMVVPVFFPRSVGSFFRPPIFSPFSKWREYLKPSRQMAASKLFAGVLGGAGAQAVQTQGVFIVIPVAPVLAAGVQLADTSSQLYFCSFSFQSTGQPRPWSSTWMDLSR